MIFNIGPFQLYRTERTGTLDITLRCMEDWGFGWEYGWRDSMRSIEETPIVEFRVGKLMILYLEVYPGGCEAWFLGFWAFPTWGKGRKK
jgi:hypothetical protein